MQAAAPWQALPHGVTVIDTGFVREHFDAAWLLVKQGRAAFVDTGTSHSVPRLLAALAAYWADLMRNQDMLRRQAPLSTVILK